MKFVNNASSSENLSVRSERLLIAISESLSTIKIFRKRKTNDISFNDTKKLTIINSEASRAKDNFTNKGTSR